MSANAASLAAQALSNVESNFDIIGGLAKGAARQALSTEIANEGFKVVGEFGERIILSDGSMVAWTPPPEKLVIPDLSEVKSLRHYFGSKGYQPYPAWLYHKDGSTILVKDAKAAAEIGIVYRKASDEERARYGIRDVWDWEQGCLWRTKPWKDPAFDPKNPGDRKIVVSAGPDPFRAQSDMVAQVAAAVAQVLKVSPGAAAPASVDPGEWAEFVQFQAWKKANEAVAGVDLDDGGNLDSGQGAPLSEAEMACINALSPSQDREIWEEEAKRIGLKIDGRWSLERLKAEVNKASGNAA